MLSSPAFCVHGYSDIDQSLMLSMVYNGSVSKIRTNNSAVPNFVMKVYYTL